MIPPSSPSMAAFVAVLIAVLVGVGAALHRAGGARWAGLGAGAMLVGLAVTGAFAHFGFAARGFPWLMGFMVVCNATAVGVALSPVGKRVAETVPVWALVGFHAFRLPLELVLHAWADQGVIPESMTWTGQNIDVLAGIGALVVAPLAWRWRPAAWVFALGGLGLLINVARVAMQSVPGPLQRFGDPDLLVAMQVPTVWILPVAVCGALAAHVILIRALLRRP